MVGRSHWGAIWSMLPSSAGLSARTYFPLEQLTVKLSDAESAVDPLLQYQQEKVPLACIRCWPTVVSMLAVAVRAALLTVNCWDTSAPSSRTANGPCKSEFQFTTVSTGGHFDVPPFCVDDMETPAHAVSGAISNTIVVNRDMRIGPPLLAAYCTSRLKGAQADNLLAQKSPDHKGPGFRSLDARC